MAYPVEIRFVSDAERELGRTLPSAYIDRICRLNGGDVHVAGEIYTLHPIRDTSDRRRMAKSTGDIIRETATQRSYCIDFPDGALVIADNGAGDLLVLLPAADGPQFAETVYRWDHETQDLTAVADSFEDVE